MPPNLSAHHPPWPWSGGDSPPLKRAGAANKTASPKRLKTSTTEAASTNDTPSPSNSKTLPPAKDTNTITITDQHNTVNVTKKKKSDTVLIGKAQQGKITEYFKSQMKTNGVKKELLLAKANGDVTNRNKIDIGKTNSTIDMENFLKLIDEQKASLNEKCTKFTPDLYKKFDVRALNVVTPVKKVMLDTKTKKISQLIPTPRKVLPGPKPSDKNKTPPTPSPPVKLTAVRIQQDQKCITTKNVKPLDNLFINTATKLGNKLTAIPIVKRTSNINHNNNNTSNNNSTISVIQSQVTNLNLKVSSTVVPIVKLNTMPSKLNGSNLNNNVNTTLCVDTAVPTVPSAKPKNSTATTECLLKPLLLSPIEKSVHQKLQHTVIEITQQKKCKTESCSKAESSKSTDSDSGVSVKELLSVSVTPTPEIEEQKSPILSQPKTIRFPAKQTTTEQRNEQRKSNVSDSGLCRWSECEAQFDTSGALLEHLQVIIINLIHMFFHRQRSRDWF